MLLPAEPVLKTYHDRLHSVNIFNSDMAMMSAEDIKKSSKYRGWLSLALLLAIAVGSAAYWYVWTTSPHRYFQRGVEAFSRNDPDEIQVDIELLRGMKNYEPHLRLLQGMLSLRQGMLRPAIVEFGYAKDHEETRALAYALSGEALYKAKLYNDAERILLAAIQLDPSNTDSRRWLAALYYDIGAMNHAMDQLEIIAEQAPDDARPHRMMGLMYKDFEEYKKAIDQYRESLRLDSNQPDKNEQTVELAECLLSLREYDEVLSLLRLCPVSSQTLTFWAKCHYAKGDKPLARKLVQEALEKAPNDLAAMQFKALMDMESNDPASAVAILQQAVQYHPKDYRVRLKLAQAYQRLGKRDLAQKQAEAMKGLRELRQRFTKLHEQAFKDPHDVDLRYQLGLVAQQLDKPALAVGWFEVVLSMDPEHKGARQALDKTQSQTASSSENKTSNKPEKGSH